MLNFHQSLPFLNWLFPSSFSHQIFPQDFPELDPDWLAPHHPIPNAQFPPITAFLKLAFSPSPFSARISHKIFLQEFPARIFRKNFPQDFPTTISDNNFPQVFPARFSCKIFPKLDPDCWTPHHPFPNAKFPPITAFLKLAFSPPPFPTRFSRNNFLQDFPTTISDNNFPQDFPARFSQAGSWLVSSPSP